MNYSNAHRRVRRVRGTPTRCEHCGKVGGTTRQYHWANISGVLTDPDDYVRLCVSCHAQFDHSKFNGWKRPDVAERNRRPRPDVAERNRSHRRTFLYAVRPRPVKGGMPS